MEYHISDSEWKIMEILWEKGIATQNQIQTALEVDWNKNTVYTFLHRLEQKGIVKSGGSPKQYQAAVGREECVEQEQKNFLDKLYHGSAGRMVTAFLEKGKLTEKEVEDLKQLLEGMDV